MSKARLFEYAILWHPTEKQTKEEGTKSKVIVQPKTLLATDENGATMAAAMDIPTEYRDQLDQIQIAMRPF
jgi:hypothetical protein